jgi:hypothetical protein
MIFFLLLLLLHFSPPYCLVVSEYSDTSANEDNSFRNHIR